MNLNWYEQRLKEHQERSDSRGETTLFHQVSAMQFANLEPAQRVASLLALANSIAHVEGLGHMLIQLAGTTQFGTACATFLDAPTSFEKPLILLDQRFFAADVEPDVFIGLVLHEIGHIHFTRLFFQRRRSSYDVEGFLCNLLEDYRIERLLSGSSHAWRQYLERMRLRLFETSLAEAWATWSELSDFNRTVVLLGSFLFAPEEIERRPESKQWCNAVGTNVFLKLQEILPAEFVSEEEIEIAVQKIINEFVRTLPLGSRTTKGKPLVYRRRDSGSEGQPDQERDREGESGDSRHDRPTDSEEIRTGSGWSWRQLAEKVAESSECRQPFDDAFIQEVQKALTGLDGCRPSPGNHVGVHPDSSKPSACQVKFLNIVALPANQQKYRSIAGEFQQVISELQDLFADRHSGVSGKRSGQWVGRLDSRRLYRHGFDDRLFYQSARRQTKLPTTMVGVLLDGSGSMAGEPEAIAFRLGVILIEAMRGAKNVAVRIFSHSALSANICEIQCFGDQHQAVGTLGTYQARDRTNFDDLAVRVVAQELEKTAADKRVLFIVSDAHPFVSGASRLAGIEMTRQAVSELRKRGWQVLGLALGNPKTATRIFGDDHVLLKNRIDITRNFVRLLKQLFLPN